MRIAFYSPRSSHLVHALEHGGDPILIDALFAALRARGHEIVVVSRLNVRDLWRGRVPIRGFLREARRVRKEMQRFQPDAWLVYNPSPTYPDVFGWWQRPRRYVLLGAHQWQSKSLPRRWRGALSLIFRRSVRRADYVVAARPAAAKRLLAAGATENQVIVMGPAVELEADVPAREDARRRLNLPEDVPIVLVVSRFTSERESSEKKTETVLALLDTFAGVSTDSLLVVVGDGPGRPRIERALGELGLRERVRLAGAVEHQELKWFHAASDLYAYPDLVDRTRLSVLEAQAFGRPVIVLRTESAEMTVDDGRTGLIAADIHDFREHLAALVRDRRRCREMGRAARDYVACRHSVDARAHQLEELLH